MPKLIHQLNCTKSRSYHNPYIVKDQYQITFHPDVIIVRLDEDDDIRVPFWTDITDEKSKRKVTTLKYFIRTGQVLNAWSQFKEQFINLPEHRRNSYNEIINQVPQLESYFTVETEGEIRLDFNFEWDSSASSNLAMLQQCYNNINHDLKPEVQLNIEWLTFLHQLELEDPEHENRSERWLKFMDRFLFSNSNISEYKKIIYAIYYYFVRDQYWFADYAILIPGTSNKLKERMINFDDDDQLPLGLTDEQWEHYEPYLSDKFEIYAPDNSYGECDI